MSAFLKASDRLRIGRALLARASAENVQSCAQVARALVGDATVDQILTMPEVMEMPETRRWLAHELGRAVGVIAAEAA